MADYPNTGALFTSKNKTKDTQPDMFGDMKFNRIYLIGMIEKAGDSDEVLIKLDAWVKRDKNNNRMVSMKVNSYEKPAMSQQKDPWDD